MDEMFPQKKRRNSVVALQLAPLIDIFTLLIIFLIKGTVMSGATVAPPADLKPATSKSAESMEPAAELYITPTTVHFAMIKDQIPVAEIMSQIDGFTIDRFSGHSQQIVEKMRRYIQKMPLADKKAGVLINLLADASVDYRTTFEISKFLREIGFQNILYVAEGERN